MIGEHHAEVATFRLAGKSTPLFDGLIKAKVLKTSVFTVTLTTGTASTLYLGGVDPKAGTPTYVNVDTSQGYWYTTASKINTQSYASIVDTGTTLIIAPTSVATKLFKSMSGVTTYTQDDTLYGSYDCSNPPKVTYTFGNFEVRLSSSTISFGQTESGQCVLSVVGADTGIDAIIAGDSFLQNVHAVFDRKSNRLGFSKQ